MHPDSDTLKCLPGKLPLFLHIHIFETQRETYAKQDVLGFIADFTVMR